MSDGKTQPAVAGRAYNDARHHADDVPALHYSSPHSWDPRVLYKPWGNRRCAWSPVSVCPCFQLDQWYKRHLSTSLYKRPYICPSPSVSPLDTSTLVHGKGFSIRQKLAGSHYFSIVPSYRNWASKTLYHLVRRGLL